MCALPAKNPAAEGETLAEEVAVTASEKTESGVPFEAAIVEAAITSSADAYVEAATNKIAAQVEILEQSANKEEQPAVEAAKPQESAIHNIATRVVHTVEAAASAKLDKKMEELTVEDVKGAAETITKVAATASKFLLPLTQAADSTAIGHAVGMALSALEEGARWFPGGVLAVAAMKRFYSLYRESVCVCVCVCVWCICVCVLCCLGLMFSVGFILGYTATKAMPSSSCWPQSVSIAVRSRLTVPFLISDPRFFLFFLFLVLLWNAVDPKEDRSAGTALGRTEGEKIDPDAKLCPNW